MQAASGQEENDKTLPLLDIEKRLEVKSALRDRLTAMLRDSAAKSVADVVAIEKELAEVHGEIEARGDPSRLAPSPPSQPSFWSGRSSASPV